VGTQREAPCQHAGVQPSGCRECRSPTLAVEGCRDNTCVTCDQVNDLLVAELKDEVARLRTIRESEREIDSWSHFLNGKQQAPQEAENPLPSGHQATRGDLKDGEEWKQVPARRERKIPALPPSPSRLPLQNRYEALDNESQAKEETGGGSSIGLSRVNQSATRIRTSLAKKKRRVIVTGDSLLRGTEDPIRHLDLTHREVCCLPGARIKDMIKKLPGLVKPSDYYPLLVMQIDNDEIAERWPEAIKRDLRALGQMLEGSGAQVVFASIPSIMRKNSGSFNKVRQINTWLKGWCQQSSFGFFNHGEIYMAPGLLKPDGVQTMQKGKRILCFELEGLTECSLS
ncbi:hypothetical protein N311_01383, partial [Apaloderma vittatum]